MGNFIEGFLKGALIVGTFFAVSAFGTPVIGGIVAAAVAYEVCKK